MRASPDAMRVGAMVLTAAAFVCALYIPDDAPRVPIDTTTARADAAITDARRSDPRPNVLLFTIDTVRADHVSGYGYERNTMPNLTRLAGRGTRFVRAYSTSSWTVPGVASILIGVLPSQHGVIHGFWLDGETIVGQEVLSPELPTITTQLHDAGYRTIGVTTNVHLDPVLGFGHGFDTYVSLDYASSSAEIHTEVDRHLDELRTSAQPFFLWVHLIDPHAPYVPQRPIFDTWRPPSMPQYPAIDSWLMEEFLPMLMSDEHIPPDDGLLYAVAAYDSEIHTSDAYLGTLLEQIDDGHLAVVVTADHGEEFGDHLRIGHGHTAFEEVVRVPLVIAVPGQASHVVSTTPVSLVDVLPTLLELAHVMPAGAIAGRSLLPATRGEAVETRDVVIETGRGREVVRAIVDGWIKYGRRVEPNPIEGLFDLEADPHEIHNLVDERPDVARALRERLDGILRAASARRPTLTTVPIEISDRIRLQLEALGYAN